MVQTACKDHGCKGYGLGYATAKYQGRYTTKHRVVLLKALGMNLDDAAGLEARHLCNNPRCINPYHLEFGTALDNAQDKIKAGTNVNRPMPGEANGRCVLTDLQVELIRAEYVRGSKDKGCTALARKYGVGASQISRIVRGVVR